MVIPDGEETVVHKIAGDPNWKSIVSSIPDLKTCVSEMFSNKMEGFASLPHVFENTAKPHGAPEVVATAWSDHSDSDRVDNPRSQSHSPEISVVPFSANASRLSLTSVLNSSRGSTTPQKSGHSSMILDDGLITPKKNAAPTPASVPRRKLSTVEKIERDRLAAERKLKLQAEKDARETKKLGEARVKEDLRKKREEEKQQKDLEAKQRADKLLREKAEKEQERKTKEEERERERKRKEDDRLKKEKEKEDETKRKLEEKLRKEEEKKKQEDERNEHKRQKEEERIKKEADLLALEQKKNKTLELQQKMMASFVIQKPKPVVQNIASSAMAFFQPYEIQDGVRLAPKLRVAPLSPSKAAALTSFLNSDFNSKYAKPENLYISDLKSRKRAPEKYPATCLRGCTDEVMILSDTEADARKRARLRVKLIQFHDNARPPFYGTMRRKSTVFCGRNPFAADMELLDYEVDSDEEWEEEHAAGEADDCEEEMKSEDEEEDEPDDFLVPDEEEMQNQSNNDGQLTDEEDEIRPVRSCVEEYVNQKKILRLKKRIIGPYWDDQGEDCHKVLKKLAIITIVQDFGEVLKSAVAHEEVGFGVSKIPENVMPFFIRLLHGSQAKKTDIAQSFLDLLVARESADSAEKFPGMGDTLLEILNNSPQRKTLRKSIVVSIITTVAHWMKPIIAEKVQHKCWYVMEDVRKFYKVLEGLSLPNPAALRVTQEKRKAEEMDSTLDTTPKAPKAQKLDTFTELPKPRKVELSSGSTPKPRKIELSSSSSPKARKLEFTSITPMTKKTLDGWLKTDKSGPVVLLNLSED